MSILSIFERKKKSGAPSNTTPTTTTPTTSPTTPGPPLPLLQRHLSATPGNSATPTTGGGPLPQTQTVTNTVAPPQPNQQTNDPSHRRTNAESSLPPLSSSSALIKAPINQTQLRANQQLERKYIGLKNFRMLVQSQYDAHMAGKLNQKESSSHVLHKEEDKRKGKTFTQKLGISAKETVDDVKEGLQTAGRGLHKPRTNKEDFKKTAEAGLEGVSTTAEAFSEGVGTSGDIKDMVEIKDKLSEGVARYTAGEVDASEMNVLSLVSSSFTTIKEVISFVSGLSKSVYQSIKKRDISYFKKWALKEVGIDLIFNENSSISDKVMQGFTTLAGAISWLQDKLSVAKAILDVVISGSVAIPVLGAIISGLSMVVNGIDMGLQIWKVVKASKSKKSMKEKHDKLINKLKSKYVKTGKGNQKAFDEVELRNRRRSLEVKEDDGTITPEEQNELYDIRTFMLSADLKRVNEKRQIRGGLEIFYDATLILSDAVGMAGSIATATGVGAAGGAVVSGVATGMKFAIQGAKFFQLGLRTVKQKWHNIQGSKKSMVVKDAVRLEDTRHLFKMVKSLPDFDPTNSEIVGRYQDVEDYVDAAGCMHGRLYSMETIEDAEKYMIESMKQRS